MTGRLLTAAAVAFALLGIVAACSPNGLSLGGLLADRIPGWEVLDVDQAPDLGLGPLPIDDARRLNALLAARAPATGAAPFFLHASKAERGRALLCLSQAIYYEAALEPPEGQEAVAQTVLNRVRHPDFPKSICGVVYQGSAQVTGCQFSFTCDGSRARPPIEPFWSRAQAVAERALAGYVMPAVGEATHYHADYVFPRWGPTLVKIGQFGAQIFYRFPGPPGQPDAFSERYRGGELKVSMAGPPPEAILAYRQSLLAGGLVPTQIANVGAPSSPFHPRAEVMFGRRAPTQEEVSHINSVLEAMAAAAHSASASADAKADGPATR